MWLKIKELRLRGFQSFHLPRWPFWYRFFEPLPFMASFAQEYCLFSPGFKGNLSLLDICFINSWGLHGGDGSIVPFMGRLDKWNWGTPHAPPP